MSKQRKAATHALLFKTNRMRQAIPIRTAKSKIKALRELRHIISGLKRQGLKVVFTNGCFDLLHYGHVKYLEDAKRKGDILVVGINSDMSVKRIKGEGRPVVSEGDRLKTVAALESVDYAFLFDEDTPLKCIKFIKPDMLVKGADWDINSIAGKEIVLANGGRVACIRLIRGRSTTGLIRKIVKSYQS